jgi:recombination protein RecT
MIAPHVAATVMIARDTPSGIEVFMLRRSSRSAFMPDMFVFPGGRVESQDAGGEALAKLAGTLPPLDASCVYAAVRETFEECGLLFATSIIDAGALTAARVQLLAGGLTFAAALDALETRIDAGALRYFSRWITPPSEPRRFDTHFFVARAPANQAAQADARETHDGLWIAPREALARSAAGAFALIFPTIKHLERVADFDSIDALLAFAAAKPIHTVMPVGDDRQGVAIPTALEGVW